MNVEYTDELEKVGYLEPVDPLTLVDQSQYYYAHRACVEWSMTVQKDPEKINSYLNLNPVILQSLNRKCSFCGHFGASLACKVHN